MSEPSHETSMLLGELKAQVAALTAAMKDQSDRSDAGRSRIYQELEEVKTTQAGIINDIRHMKLRLDKNDPVLSLVTRWEERIRGMVILLLLIGAALGGAVAMFWKWIAVKFGIN